MGKLKVGEVVKWEGCFGTDIPKDAVIRGIQITNGDINALFETLKKFIK